MKSKFLFLPMLALLILLSACNDRTVRIFEANIPIYQPMDEWRQTQFELSAPRDLVRPGKIYIKNNFLFVNEYMVGVHFFDNSNPSNPVNIGFLKVLANVDIAIMNNTLFLDSYNDLLAFDISDVQHPTLIDREQDVFEFTNWWGLEGYNPNYPVAQLHPENGVIIGWNVAETSEDVSNNYWGWGGGPGVLEDFAGGAPTGGVPTGGAPNGGGVTPIGGNGTNNLGGPGTGGSTAQFTIYQNYLYILDDMVLNVFEISPVGATPVGEITISRNGETLFPSGNLLFVGTTTGMIILDLTNPVTPVVVGDYEHVRSCDPVVVAGNRAYLTLSSGNLCPGDQNQLHVIDISVIQTPQILVQYEMTNPRGMGIDGNTLFLCDGPDGLKVFDRSDDFTIDQNMISHFPSITSNDVIPVGGVLIMTSEEGIYQYDYSNLANITQLSLIPVRN